MRCAYPPYASYSSVIPLISGNPVTNISLIFFDRFVEDFPDNGLNRKVFQFLPALRSGPIRPHPIFPATPDGNDHAPGHETQQTPRAGITP
uniref:Uncharacterized protein n=1 Tax=Candidatus Kentrum sp. UNK TaxID=2126344 RepID=A0A451A4I6_9GAMM|nr:MAG: hypothetical protein BECKUNK1418G_GA0071005_101424 [Candidatus Kentron sp. UNK]VFK69522.1 MAG: hypothetical protein BECKUNK1418H_GA0071006_101521 [Candidatus Kentron sp. UNK]